MPSMRLFGPLREIPLADAKRLITRPRTTLLLALIDSPLAVGALAPLSSIRGEPVNPGCVVPSMVTVSVTVGSAAESEELKLYALNALMQAESSRAVPVLLELAHLPAEPQPADLEFLRRRIEAQGLLFKTRVAAELLTRSLLPDSAPPTRSTV